MLGSGGACLQSQQLGGREAGGSLISRLVYRLSSRAKQ